MQTIQLWLGMTKVRSALILHYLVECYFNETLYWLDMKT